MSISSAEVPEKHLWGILPIRLKEFICSGGYPNIFSLVAVYQSKSQNIFVANGLKDISLLKKERNSKLNMSVEFKFVPTYQNPDDLIKRGLTWNK